VAFVSLTAEPRERAEAFAKAAPVPWPCGYGLSAEQVARWGAASRAAARAAGAGYGLRPTLYLLGPDGRVLWCDGQSRPRHHGDAAEQLRRLDEAITHALESAGHAT